ncbi:restriction endonuclease subunit S [Vampirovibrio sp.]|uniref:restriction endonuclease subunit S n=1 Tax=Vampirovibrio sp. TaxID=2717857 RepID=UPI0035935912
MKDWPLVSLGDIFEIARGGSPRPIDKFITEDIDGINWIMISDASDRSKYITKTKKRILQSGVKNSRMVYPGDFLLTNSMSFGKPYIMQTTGCIHDGWLVFSNKKKLADPDYFYHLLGSSLIYSEFERRAAGATVKNLNIDLVRSVEIPLPPLAEQKRIAAILDQADALRKARRRAIERLNDLSQSIFYEMFGDPSHAKESWPILELKDVVKTRTIVTYGIVQAGEEFPGGVPYIRTGDIVNGEIRQLGLRHTDPELAAKFERSRVEAGDIVMSIRATVGTTAFIPENLNGANLTQGTARVAPGEKTNGTYLLYYLRSPSTQGWIERQVKGATFREITLSRLRELPVLVPPMKLQQSFGKKISLIENIKKNALANSDKMENLFSSLQQRAFRGELSGVREMAQL